MVNPQNPNRQTPAKPTFFARLRADVAGNTLMLVAGAILPLTAMIGAGVDVSRVYLVKTRLQQACDAGALATRQKMAGDTTISSAATAQGQSFFNNNFTTGLFGTSGTSFTTGLDADNQVTASANTSVPATIMTIFGNRNIALGVRCDAKLEVANTDIMFVLDTTGSMNLCPDGSDTCGGGGPGSRIVGLRAAVLDFYDVIGQSVTASSQLRFGFVPYAANVNVGALLPAGALVTDHTYESAVANMTTPVNQPTPGTPVTNDDPPRINVSNATCNTYSSNVNGTNNGSPVNSGGPPPAATVVTTVIKKSFSGTSKKNGDCVRTKTVTTTTYTRVYTLTNWTLKPVSYDVRAFVAGSSVSIATGDPAGFVATSGAYNLLQLAAQATAGAATTSVTWDKCIEERDTVASASFTAQSGGTFSPGPAHDLEIDTLPTDQATRWRPGLHQLAIDRPDNNTVTQSGIGTFVDAAGGGPNPCPLAATKLATMTRADVANYVNALSPGGSTYHDAGMVWGARLLSPTGLFAAENAVAANGKPISRHLIFMTDGVMCARGQAVSFQGFERASRRVTGTNAPEDCYTSLSAPTQDAMIINQRHKARFLAICEAAKAMNISVWTVAFGTDNPPNLVTCANTGQALSATSTAALQTQFQKIAAKIASLRISR